MNAGPCHLCGGDQADVLFAAGLAQSNQIVRCRGCSLMYAHPIAIEFDESRVARFDPEYLDGMLQRDYDPRRDKESLQVRDYDDTCRLLAQQFPHRGDLLEIGFGLGFLLARFHQEGWRTLGIDPDPLACRHAERVLGLDVRACTLPEAGFAPGSFDAVVMIHVIEHVPDPAALLTSIHTLLRPGGLLILETPRLDSLSFRLLRHRERSIACEGHIHFYTLQTLAALGRKSGFEVVRQDIVGRSMTLDRVLWNVGVVSKNARLKALIEVTSRKLALTRLMIRVNLHDMQRMYLRRTGAA